MSELNPPDAEFRTRNEDLLRATADMRSLFETTQIATVFVDKNQVIRSYTPAAASIFDIDAGHRGRRIADIAHNLGDVDLAQDVLTVVEDSKPLQRIVQQHDSRAFHLMRILPIADGDDSTGGALITFVNVTAVILAEEKQRLLVRELNHRVRNMLQVVMGLASQTIHRSESLEHFKSGFFGRMQALARAFELLSRDGRQNAPLAELVRSQLAPFASEGNRFTLRGGHHALTANAALSLGLVLYELATNATKYGALSVSSGQVHVSWWLNRDDVGRQELIVQWRESGGPAVATPTRAGFGTELVQRQLKFELNGRATMDFAVTGLTATLMLPPKDTLEAWQERKPHE